MEEKTTKPRLLHQQLGDIWSEFMLDATHETFKWEKKEMPALTKIAARIKEKLQNMGKEPSDELACKWWRAFLENRDLWPNWLKPKWELTIINSKFNEIYTQIQNGRTAIRNRAGGPNFTAAGLNAEIEKRYPTNPANAEPPN